MRLNCICNDHVLPDVSMVRVCLTLLFASACSGPTTPTAMALDAAPPDAAADAAATMPEVELGSGLTSFVDIQTTGAELELVFGPQGGWHFNLTARLTGFVPEGLALSYAVADEGGVALHYPSRVVLNARRVVDAGTSVIRLGDRVVLDVRDGRALVGRNLTVSVEAVGANGSRALSARTVTVVDRER